MACDLIIKNCCNLKKYNLFTFIRISKNYKMALEANFYYG